MPKLLCFLLSHGAVKTPVISFDRYEDLQLVYLRLHSCSFAHLLAPLLSTTLPLFHCSCSWSESCHFFGAKLWEVRRGRKAASYLIHTCGTQVHILPVRRRAEPSTAAGGKTTEGNAFIDGASAEVRAGSLQVCSLLYLLAELRDVYLCSSADRCREEGAAQVSRLVTDAAFISRCRGYESPALPLGSSCSSVSFLPPRPGASPGFNRGHNCSLVKTISC